MDARTLVVTSHFPFAPRPAARMAAQMWKWSLIRCLSQVRADSSQTGPVDGRAPSPQPVESSRALLVRIRRLSATMNSALTPSTPRRQACDTGRRPALGITAKSRSWPRDLAPPLPDCLGSMVTRVHETGVDAGWNKCRTRTDITRIIGEKI
jgi:hypothetical protein